ncbi:MAG: chitobiase/beta-hexosaminidase C-terminal domain-containing protein [Polyangiaceae bacterium]|nr:chitobiase/beta-hexosaminidase C-terminal domain-containing protein [Polyangiaceae bacterium]
MRLLFTSLFGLAVVVATGAAQAVCEGGVPKLSDANYKDCSRDGMKCGYWEPATNDPNTKYPLVIFLHGAGASGTNNNTQQVDDGWTCQLQELIENRTTYPAYIMAPRAPNYDTGLQGGAFVHWDWGTSDATYNITTLAESQTLITARAMMQALQTQYANIDPDRIYVVGVSMGGYGTWDLISRTPDLFAAGVPAEGGGSPQAAPSLKNMAIWAEHDDQDQVSAIGDQETFAAVARAGGRPYYTEAVSSSHGLGMGLSASMGFVPWMFAQRRGVPSTPAPWLVFSPEGGQLDGPTVTVSLSATPQSDSIYYTTDGSIPNAITHVGTKYTAPFTLSASAVVIAAAHHNVEGTDMNVFHAAPFKVGDSPLPAGAELMPYTPYVPPGGASSGAGGASSNSGGVANPFPPAAGGARAATGGAPASSGSGGTKPSTSGGAASIPAVVRPAGTTKSSGCSLASTNQSGNSLLSFGLASVAVAAFASRRRNRSSRS